MNADAGQQLTFRGTIDLAGKTATGIRVPAEIVEALGTSRKPAVRVTVGDYTYRTTVAVRGGEFKIPLSAENRDGAGVTAGDEVDVGIALDTEPREVTVPPDLAEALDREPEARQFFDGLTHSQKQWYVLPIEQAKAAETRERRITKAIGMLLEGRKR